MTNRVDVTLYTRPGCHLCDEAAARLVELAEQLPIGVQAIDIEGDVDAAILERYNNVVPAVHVSGVPISVAPLDWMAIRAAVTAGLIEPNDDNTESGTGFAH
jgi:thiol-disulfide isomerase/thioredoxin